MRVVRRYVESAFAQPGPSLHRLPRGHRGGASARAGAVQPPDDAAVPAALPGLRQPGLRRLEGVFRHAEPRCCDAVRHRVRPSPIAAPACCRGPEEFSVFAGALWKWRRQWRRRRDDSVQRPRRERAARDAFLRSTAIHLEHGEHHGNHDSHEAEDGLANDLQCQCLQHSHGMPRRGEPDRWAAAVDSGLR